MPRIITLPPESPPADPMAFARVTEVPRQQLFRACAVAQAITTLMRNHDFEGREADLAVVFAAVVQMLNDSIAELEPLQLGLPIPNS